MLQVYRHNTSSMNFYLVFYIDKILEEAMVRFAKSLKHSMFYYEHNGFILRYTKRMIGFYETFFKQIGFLARGYSYYKSELLTEISLDDKDILEFDRLLKRLVSIDGLLNIELPIIKNRLLAVHVHYSTKTEIHLVTGMAILERGSATVRFVLHELGIPKHLLKPTPQHLKYLNKVLEQYTAGDQKSVKDLLEHLDRNYNQFQKDCKAYYGGTFYEFYTKKRMVNVVGDIMFSHLTLKEIAYNNGFSSYDTMYKSFAKYDGLVLADIPRFFKGA